MLIDVSVAARQEVGQAFGLSHPTPDHRRHDRSPIQHPGHRTRGIAFQPMCLNFTSYLGWKNDLRISKFCNCLGHVCSDLMLWGSSVNETTAIHSPPSGGEEAGRGKRKGSTMSRRINWSIPSSTFGNEMGSCLLGEPKYEVGLAF